jgi:hypothetical protein
MRVLFGEAGGEAEDFCLISSSKSQWKCQDFGCVCLNLKYDIVVVA